MIVEPWAVGVDSFDVESLGRLEALLAQGNGYLGFRAATEERYVEEDRRTVVGSVFDRAAGPREVVEAVALPDVLAILLTLDGERVAFDRGSVRSYSRMLHLDDGSLVTRVEWVASSGVVVHLSTVRVASLADRHVVATRIELRVDDDVRLGVDSGVDGTASNGGVQHLHELDRSCRDATSVVRDVTTGSGVEVVVRSTTVVSIAGERAQPTSRRITRRSVATGFEVEVAAGMPVAIEKISTLHTSRDILESDGDGDGDGDGVVDTDHRSRDGHDAAVRQGFDAHVDRSAAAWAAFWRRADVQITSDEPLDQLSVRHALYHLRCMTSQDDEQVSVGAKGFTGAGYQGHAFWDTEVYVMPVWLHLDPATARRLLRYRIRMVEPSRQWAAANGFEGMMIPWETAYVTDGDVTPSTGRIDAVTGERERIDTGQSQHHISAIVADAVDRYVRTTGDHSLLDDGGLGLLCGIARFWSSRVEGPDEHGTWHINDVIGPDEYSIGVDDNAFTNHLARRALHIAADRAAASGAVGDGPDAIATEDETTRWREVAAGLAVPVPDEDGVIDQDTTFRSLPPLPGLDELRHDPTTSLLDLYSLSDLPDHRVAKQADVVALLLLEGEQRDVEVRRANLRFYEPVTAHDSSLSAPTFCVVAARAGEADLAHRLWERARAVDLGARSSVAGGVHAAALGGIWQCVVLGFAGVTVRDGELDVDPRLPAGWHRLRVRLTVAGRPVEVVIDEDGVDVTPVG